jgi:hypothetical protein
MFFLVLNFLTLAIFLLGEKMEKCANSKKNANYKKIAKILKSQI